MKLKGLLVLLKEDPKAVMQISGIRFFDKSVLLSDDGKCVDVSSECLASILSCADVDDRIYLRDISSDNEVVGTLKSWMPDGSETLRLASKNNTDVAEDLEDWFKWASDPSNDVDELDFVTDLLDLGYVLEDFEYNNDRYLWMKEFMENHGLI